MRSRSTIFAVAAGLAAVGVAGIAGFATDWAECRTCGVQRYERRVFGIHMEALSERGYDEYGTQAAWTSLHGRRCDHHFVPVDRTNGPVAATR